MLFHIGIRAGLCSGDLLSTTTSTNGGASLDSRYRRSALGLPDRGRGLTRLERTVALLGLMTVACGDEATTVRNDGSLCISATPTSLEIKVYFDACMSSSCDRQRNDRCRATLEENVIVVQSSVEIVHDSGGGDCTTDCEPPTTACAMELPEPGRYIVAHGGSDDPITLPLTDPVALFDENACRRR